MINANILKSKKLFFRFLKENKAYVNYTSLTFYNIDHLTKEIGLHNYVSCFLDDKGWSWRDSPQGNAYWSNIHSKWSCHLYKTYISNTAYGFIPIDTIIRNIKTLIYHI